MGIKVERYTVTKSDPRLSFIGGVHKAGLLHLPSALSLAPRCYARLQPESNFTQVCSSTKGRVIVVHCETTKRSVIITFDNVQNPLATLPSHLEYLRNGQTTANIEIVSVLQSTDLDVLPPSVLNPLFPLLGASSALNVTVQTIKDDQVTSLTVDRSDGTLTLYYPSPEVLGLKLVGSDLAGFGAFHRLMILLDEDQEEGSSPSCHYDGLKGPNRLPPLSKHGAALLGAAQALNAPSSGRGGNLARFSGLKDKVQALLDEAATGNRVPGLEAARMLLLTAAEGFCIVCAKEDGLKKCSGCKDVYYCGSMHQKEDWPFHRDLCKLNRKTKGP
ncbi:hypothetical protein BCR35DRAFT_337896 [Leucosporidium creatinivorum]|uniref:MYND-type domain-containing protein n=1 Tax=Leucosporidium creatinivorum TaxID=106004 RepID=A0A1Y2FWD5_9BASI|nr:hypothetical protein BCR35DRAFT_337896 [Leucosporidium creatinivorum]